MKTNAIASLSYTEKDNIINLTLEPITEESKAYIVDQRFMDHFLNQFSGVPFTHLQSDLKALIDQSTTFEIMASNIEEFMYLHKVANHPELKKPEVKEPVTNEFKRQVLDGNANPILNKVGKIRLDDVHGGLSQSEEDRHNEHLQNSMENQSTEQ